MNYICCTILSIFFNIMICYNINSNIEYLIYTSSIFSNHAERIESIYEGNQIANEYKLVTDILYNNQIEEYYLQSYLFNPENGFIDSGGNFINLKYLLIIGDETIIIPSNYCVDTATDDYYSSSFTLEENQTCNSHPPNPQLITGRILINDPSSYELIEDIETYIINPHSGDWKNKLLLFCDDQFKSGGSIVQEKTHVVNSDKIYNSLKNDLNISCLYGSEFERQQSIGWFTQPNFTDKIIETINNGLGIINYIGHGTSELLADENILTISDLERISISNNRLPIWVVGTCSFGNYMNENCFAEKLLNKGDAAIAVISTTGGVTYSDNFIYLSSFFEEHLKNYLDNDEGYEFYRIGDIFFDAKNSIQQLSKRYTFNLFGDPAIPLNIPKNYNLLDVNENTLYLGSEYNLNLNESGKYTLKILDKEKNRCICEDCDEIICQECISYNECISNNDCDYIDETNLITYNLPGNILFLNQANTIDNNLLYALPIDANIENNLSLNIYNHDLNKTEVIPCLNLDYSENFSFSDNIGPEIDFLQNGSLINNGSTIYPPYEIEIKLNDESPINLSGFNYHNIRFWYDNDQSNSIILNDSFISDYISLNETSNYSGSAFITLNPDKNFNQINIEAWDILNNSTIHSLYIKLFNNLVIYNVYNFPNPFSQKTYFTFGYSESSPLDIYINIYSLDGTKIKSIYEQNINNNSSNFIKVPESGWDGVLENGNKISNGTYIYFLKILQNNHTIYEGFHKLTKLE